MRFVLILVALSFAVSLHAADDSWPRTFKIGDTEVTTYVPEIVSLEGYVAKGRNAFSVTLSDTNMVFGAIAFTATFRQSPADDDILYLYDYNIDRLRLTEEYV